MSPKADRSNVRRMSTTLGISLTNNLGKYFGAPLIHGRVTKATYMEIGDKVNSRLSSCKSLHLSLAGGATLIKALTSAVPTYHMQRALLPSSITGTIDKLNRRFLWGGNEEKHALHLVSRANVCKPSSFGVLGLRRMDLHNMAILQKTAWRLFLHFISRLQSRPI